MKFSNFLQRWELFILRVWSKGKSGKFCNFKTEERDFQSQPFCLDVEESACENEWVRRYFWLDHYSGSSDFESIFYVFLRECAKEKK